MKCIWAKDDRKGFILLALGPISPLNIIRKIFYNDNDVIRRVQPLSLRKGFGVFKEGLLRSRTSKDIIRGLYMCNKEGCRALCETRRDRYLLKLRICNA